MFKKYILVVLALLFGIVSLTQFSALKVSADKYDIQIQALQQEINQYQAEAGKLKDQARSLEREVTQLDSERQIIEGQISLSQVKYDKLQSEIEATKQKLADARESLGDIIADIYIDSGVSSIEMLASSKNVSEYVDKSAYQSTVANELRKTTETIKSLKKKA